MVEIKVIEKWLSSEYTYTFGKMKNVSYFY